MPNDYCCTHQSFFYTRDMHHNDLTRQLELLLYGVWNRRLLELALLKEWELSKSLYIERVLLNKDRIKGKLMCLECVV